MQNSLNRFGKDIAFNKKLIEQIKTNNFLCQIARNPLQLSILTSIFSKKGILPNSELSIFQDLTEFISSTWDSQQKRQPSILTLGEKNDFIERLAYLMLTQNKISITNSEFITLTHIVFENYKLNYNESQAILEEFLMSGVLFEKEPREYEFLHSALLEFYFAKFISRIPSKIVPILNSPKLIGIAKILTELVDDINPYIEIALEQKQVYLAAIFASFGRGARETLIKQVISDFFNEMGPRFVNFLSLDISQTLINKNQEEDLVEKDHTYLRDLLRNCQIINISVNEKGKILEAFCCKFFQIAFKVVESNFHTDNGEIDLLLEITNQEPYWLEYGGDAIVECKNWDKKVPIKEVEAFCYKVTQSRLKLGFIIAINGLTKDAEQSLKLFTSDSKHPIIVPLTGQDLDVMLQNKRPILESIKEKIRSVKYNRKY